MLDLPGVTLACVDTANPALALRALLKSREGIRFGRTLLLTGEGNSGPEPAGVEIAAVPPIDSRDDYSRFVLKELRRHIATPHVLLVQWDGYVVNPEAWDPGFLERDYLGAKWFWFEDGMRVGNGGFSLRSRKLLEALADPRIELVELEDLTICRTYRPLLEREYGIRFGDEAMADRFSFEAAYPIGRPFGFHGLFNFCRVMPPTELATLVGTFPDAIARSPQCAQLLRNCIALGTWATAIAIARRILAAAPRSAEAQALLAQAESSLAQGVGIGRNDPCPCGSGRRYKQCHGVAGTTMAPNAASPRPAADPLVSAAMAAHQRGDLKAAEQNYHAALAQAPDHPVALHYLGVIHYQRGDLAQALPLLERALALNPEEPEFHNNLGLALALANRDADAVAAFRQALARKPDHVTALNNLGLSLRARNDVDGAIAAYRRALQLQPGFAQARWNLALALLARGDYTEGWREYELRLALRVFQSPGAPVPGPRWNGEDPRGRTLLLTTEQGLGDAIQFVRLARLLANRGARVLVRAQAALVRLFRTAPGVAGVVGPDDPLPAFDAQAPLLSLPGLLGIDGTNIPAVTPYLAADATLREHARAELERLPPGLRVGLAWSGSRHYADDRRRSTTLATLAPLLSASGVTWVSLQQGTAEGEDAALASRLLWLPARNDMDGTAALIAELDRVITVDTSIGHLAGALDRPVWTLLPFASDWRWGVSGRESPWYPRTRLFRQPAPGDWKSVVEEVRGALAESAGAPKQR